MAFPYEVKVLDQCQVSPPHGSAPATSLPLTFLDFPWLLCCPVQRLFFYELPFSTHHFTQNILPNLKHSLSLTLQLFFPFSANLVCPPQPHKPRIVYNDGDSILFTVAESTGDHFNHFIGSHARDVRESHPLVPKLPPARELENNARVLPLLAIQVTVFPNFGISIGITFRHVVADGKSLHHFLKSWASINRSSGDLTCLENKSLPFFSRDVVKDPNEFESVFLKDWWNWASTWVEDASPSPTDSNILEDMVRATFVLGQAQIQGLKSWVSTQCMKNNDLEPQNMSKFVVLCAFIWVCLIKLEEGEISDNDDKLYHFVFVADCRNRSEISIPATYFGNCLALCFTDAKRSELMAENGIVAAVKAIGNRVRELESGALKGAENWMLKWKELIESGCCVSVAGSPKLGVYETDFGWGRPKMSEAVHIDVSGAISLADSRDEEDGIEVGLALSRGKMDNFKAIFEQGLKLV